MRTDINPKKTLEELFAEEELEQAKLHKLEEIEDNAAYKGLSLFLNWLERRPDMAKEIAAVLMDARSSSS